MASVKFSISVQKDTLDKLKPIQLLEDRSKNYIINKSIEEFIERYNKKMPNLKKKKV
ncbi:ribbon-helix-helix domain-containing protein [Clostridium psychrophilum]|uniref:ribbon-helix-helix domain-containing protein n=1 Tax=Clostridium psychrophilum TaxID=132926 RepID=UPI001C0AF597|nr:ribbon-helix-helix domain-containing protein [Clostridium psychrophilum]MBU3183010.1 ribbon-helix-helix domain-containing protein [Clostridium psychrophilum]